MSEITGISWCDHTLNPWIGCTKVSPCCDGCYAEAWGNRFGVAWGPGQPRRKTSAATWRNAKKWNAAGPIDGHRRRVFCASLADVFDNEVPQDWREELWQLIHETPNLDWLIVTKRIGNAAKMLPADWGFAGYPNVWLLITIGNQEEADRDIPKLFKIPAKVLGLSIEPMLGPINLHHHLYVGPEGGWDFAYTKRNLINWVIVGAASKQPKYDPPRMDLSWPRGLLTQCSIAGTAFHMKQISDPNKPGAITDIEQFPEDLRVRQMPQASR